MLKKNRYNFAAPFSIIDPHDGLYRPHDGHCWLSPCGRLGYVQISKCASTQMIAWCRQQRWQHSRYLGQTENKKRRYLVLLRDPMDRWISGIKQWMATNNYVPGEFSDHAWDLVYQHLMFDDHTMPQYRFLLGLPIRSIDAVDVVPGDGTSRAIKEILGRYGYDCWLDPKMDRNRHPGPVSRIESWFLMESFMRHFHSVYSEDYWLRLWLLDCAVPGEILKSRK